MTMPQPVHDRALVIIDDDDDDVFFLRRLLSSAAPARAILVFNQAPSALEFFERVKQGLEPLPLLTFLDIKMPASDGFEILRAVRGHRELDAMSICMLSSSAARQDVRRAKDQGAECYLVKIPFADVLRDVIDAAEQRAVCPSETRFLRVAASLLPPA